MSRQALVLLIKKRGWQLWLADYEARLKAEKWSRMHDMPAYEEWKRYSAGVTPAEYIEEIRNSVWMA